MIGDVRRMFVDAMTAAEGDLAPRLRRALPARTGAFEVVDMARGADGVWRAKGNLPRIVRDDWMGSLRA